MPEPQRRFGLTLPVPVLSLPEHRQLIEELPDAGYTDVWTGEASGADAFTPLVLAAAWSDTLRLGTAIVPVHTRGPAVIAQHAAALAELAPGRVVLGVGSSGPAFVTAFNGIPFSEPYRRVRDTLRFLRGALDGDYVTGDFDTFSIGGFQLGRPPAVPPTLMTGALRPGMLRLGWREGGGAITNFLGPRDIPAVRGAVDGLGLPDRELVCRIFVCPTPDTAYARAVGRSMLARILTRPTYHAFHAWLGRGDLMKETVRRAEAGDWAGAAAAVPDQIVDDLLVHGDIPTCRAKIQAYVEAGVDTPVLMFSGLPEHRLDASAISELVRALGPAASD